MEYVPRKKWQVKGTGRTDPAPGLFVPKLGGNSSQHSPRSIYDRNYDKHRIQSGKIVYGNKATSMWFAVGLKTDYKIPSSISLKPVSSPLIEWRGPEEHFILVNSEVKKRTDKHEEPLLKSPWVCIAENVLEEIQSSFHKLKNEVGCPNLDEQHLALVARFGKLVFHRYPSANFRNNSVSETSLRKLKRSFCTNIPPSYAENLIGAVQELGLEVDATEEMESYRVKMLLSHANVGWPQMVKDLIFIRKIELNHLRHLVVDVSCFGKNLDVRLMLRTKRIVNVLSDDEKQSISHLISSAVLDPNMKGGLRWPSGMACSEGRYKVIRVWHNKCTGYRNSSLRLRMRDVDRFDYQTSTGEFAKEVVLNLTEIVSKLQDPNAEGNEIPKLLKDNMKVIWEHFLHCDEFFSCDPTLS
uniref:DUF7903 domain-containing protein n=1 Tax=Kalanchoe fedtschenkoi TaxID=63787 RepID=A0A7N0VJL4_KALFE